MKKRTIIIIISVIVLLIIGGMILYFLLAKSPRYSPPLENPYIITKALCNENNHCEDYEITCQNGEIIGIKRITGEESPFSDEELNSMVSRDGSLFGFIQFSPDWVDPRLKTGLQGVCE